MWFLITHKRPDRCLETLKACIATGVTTPGIVVVNGGDQPAEYDECLAFLPEGWSMIRLPSDMTMGAAVRWCFKEFPGLPWYGQLCDDNVPVTPGWDKALVDAAGEDGIASCNDGWQAPHRMHSATVWAGPMLEKLGWWFPEGFNHMYIDDVWETLGRTTGKWRCLMAYLVRHDHHGVTGKVDASYQESFKHLEPDKLAFENWIKTDLEDSLEKLGGARANRLKDMVLFIATPAYGGKLDDIYLHGMVDTIPRLLSAGIAFQYRTIPNESSIEKARNIMLQEFIDSPATHLLFIDADMGWAGSDVMKLLGHNKDVVAAVGVRKTEGPPTFCVNITEIKQCMETGLLAVNEVGTGMMLISRRCVEKMLEAYPSLRWRDRASGKTFPHLFQFTNQPTGPDGAPELWSEDYTFCQRWRALGEDVWIDQMVMLGHQGQKTFYGRMHDMLMDRMAEAQYSRKPEDIPQQEAAE
jgi:hypothetical protein